MRCALKRFVNKLVIQMVFCCTYNDNFVIVDKSYFEFISLASEDFKIFSIKYCDCSWLNKD